MILNQNFTFYQQRKKIQMRTWVQALLDEGSADPDQQDPPPPYDRDEEEAARNDDRGSPKMKNNGSAARVEDDIKVDIEDSDGSNAKA